MSIESLNRASVVTGTYQEKVSLKKTCPQRK